MIYLNRLFISIIAVSAFLILNSFTYSGDEIESLRGINGFYIEVRELPKESGLAREQIQTDVELKLRLAGIKVLSKEELFKEESSNSSGLPSLYITVFVVGTEPFGCSISLHLNQRATLKRNPKIEVFPVTWSKTTIGLLSSTNFASIRDQIKDLMDSFINDYLSVNPKGGK